MRYVTDVMRTNEEKLIQEIMYEATERKKEKKMQANLEEVNEGIMD